MREVAGVSVAVWWRCSCVRAGFHRFLPLASTVLPQTTLLPLEALPYNQGTSRLTHCSQN